jgi:hypothetical protein
VYDDFASCTPNPPNGCNGQCLSGVCQEQCSCASTCSFDGVAGSCSITLGTGTPTSCGDDENYIDTTGACPGVGPEGASCGICCVPRDSEALCPQSNKCINNNGKCKCLPTDENGAVCANVIYPDGWNGGTADNGAGCNERACNAKHSTLFPGSAGAACCGYNCKS